MPVKSFKDAKGVKAALRRAGLIQLPHRVHYYDAAGSRGFTATVTVELSEDYHEVLSRGFLAEMKKEA